MKPYEIIGKSPKMSLFFCFFSLGGLVFMLLGTPSAWAIESWTSLTTSNGINASVYDITRHSIDTFAEHIYRQKAENTPETLNFCYDMYFGVRRGSTNSWLNIISEDAVSYVDADNAPGTNIIKSVQTVLSYEIETYYFAPFEANGNVLVALIKITNNGTATDGSVFSLMNFHTGANASTENESITYNGSTGTFIESGEYSFVYKSLLLPDSYSATTGTASNNPWKLVNSDRTLDKTVLSGQNNDMVAAFQYNFSLAPRASVWYGLVMGFGPNGSSQIRAEMDSYIASSTPQQLLQRAFDEWAKWHRDGKEPLGLSNEQKNLYRQSLAVLRMGQSREENTGKGQILASLTPGIWNISWVRDASYAIAALVKSGHQAEAKAGLQFMLDVDAGKTGQDYSSYLKTSNYRISSCRYYGNGDEWSDGGDDPNIELDNFGLFLWALGEYSNTYGMNDLVKPYWTIISQEIADVLVNLIESDGLLMADSSIWERHWTTIDGGRKKFTFSNVAAVHGLTYAADFADVMNDSGRASKYRSGAERIRTAITKYLVTTDDVLKSCKEETVKYYDAAVAEAFNFAVLDPTGNVAKKTLAAIAQYLPAPYAQSPGYKRNDDGSSYDNKEWINIDLRMASAWEALGDKRTARDIGDWIVNQSADNYYIMAELYNGQGRYDGSIPMCGYGAGAYILGLFKTDGADRQPCARNEIMTGSAHVPLAMLSVGLACLLCICIMRRNRRNQAQ
jgi:GH15 family glucan-1,4-alpha-glucosidase